jgi:uncharacterized surface protein with fasciclin (FAS1) repeats
MVNNFRAAGIGLAAAAMLGLTACNPSDQPSNGTGPGTSSITPPPPLMPSSSAPTNVPGVTTASDVFGPACGQLPKGGAPGSLDAMGPQSVATAASTNPLLTKLVQAVQAANLADALNSSASVTVFAPSNDAFAALGEAKFNDLASKPDQLTAVLKNHVLPMRFDAKGLEAAKTAQTLGGGTLTFSGSGDTLTVNGAHILCGNIPTKNATVFVIDKVLLPGT